MKDEGPRELSGKVAKVPGAGLALTLLLLINLFNYIDRYVLAAVEPDIRREFFGAPESAESGSAAAQAEDSTAKAKTGLLATAFMVSRSRFAKPRYPHRRQSRPGTSLQRAAARRYCDACDSAGQTW